MDTQRILVFAAGVAVGYFLFKEMNKQKVEAPAAPQVDGAATGEAVEYQLNQNNPLIAACEQAMRDSMMTMRFSSPEAQKEYEDGFMSDCLANPDKYFSSTR